MLGHALSAARSLDPQWLVVVVRHAREQVVAHVVELDPEAVVADQDDVPGTGRAVQCGLHALAAAGAAPSGTVIVTYGDVPLLSPETLAALVAAHDRDANAVTVMTATIPDPTGYGRILRGVDGLVDAVVEHADADETQRAVREVNSGLYAFDARVLGEALGRLGSANAQGELYLTDVIGIVRGDGGRVAAHHVEDVWQTAGVNDRVQLADAAGELNRRILRRWMLEGVTVQDPSTTWVDVDVTLAPDVVLLPGVQLHGATSVATGARIGPDTTLTDVEVGADAVVTRTHGSGAVVGAGATVGPFAYLRPGTRLGDYGKIGTFVETKNAVIGTGSKVPHLSYVGDATIGVHTNIGAASVFVNYDGVSKSRTVIGDHCRTGSDNMFVAPVSVGDGAYSGAGTVVRRDVPPGALAVNVAPQRNYDGWTLRRRAGTPAAEAAQRALDHQRDSEPDPAEEAAS